MATVRVVPLLTSIILAVRCEERVNATGETADLSKPAHSFALPGTPARLWGDPESWATEPEASHTLRHGEDVRQTLLHEADSSSEDHTPTNIRLSDGLPPNPNFPIQPGKTPHEKISTDGESTHVNNEREKHDVDSISDDAVMKSSAAENHHTDSGGEGLRKASSIQSETNADYIAGDLSRDSMFPVDNRHSSSKDTTPETLLTESQLPTEKRYFDSIAGSLLKKKSDHQHPDSYFDFIAGHLLKKSYPQTDIGNFDLIAGNLIKKSHPHTGTKNFDSIAGNLIKKSYPQTGKRHIDMIAGNLIKKSYPPKSKRHIDMIAGNLLKKSYYQTDPRNFDLIAGNLLKRSFPKIHKSNFDLIAGSLLKKTYPYADRSYFDSIAGNLLKKSFPLEDKRYFESIAGHLLQKRSSPQKDAQSIEPNARGVLRKSYPHKDKPFVDSIARHLLKKSDLMPDKRYIDSIAGDLIKKSSSQEDKRNIDSTAGNLIKKPSSTQENKRLFDSIAGDLLKKSYPIRHKRYIDSIAGNLIKKSRFAEEGSYIDSVLQGNKRPFDSIAGDLLKKSYPIGDKRYFDSIAGNLIKKTGSVEDTKNIKSVAQEDKRFVDSIAGDLLKKSYSVTDKRYIDSIAGDLIKKLGSPGDKRFPDSIPPEDRRFFDSIASDLLKKSIKDKRYIDSIAGDLIKRVAPPRETQSMESVSREVSKNSPHKRFVDMIAGELLKREDARYTKEQDKRQGLKEKVNHRHLHSLRSAFVKGDMSDQQGYVHIKRFLDWIAGHLLKKRGSRAVRQNSPKHHIAFRTNHQPQKNGILKSVPGSTQNHLTRTMADPQLGEARFQQRSVKRSPVDMPRSLHAHDIKTTVRDTHKDTDPSQNKTGQRTKDSKAASSDTMSKLPSDRARLKRRSAAVSPKSGFPERSSTDSSLVSKTARDAQPADTYLPFRQVTRQDIGSLHRQKRFVPLPILFTHMVIHTLPLPRLFPVSRQPVSATSPKQQDDKEASFVTNDPRPDKDPSETRPTDEEEYSKWSPWEFSHQPNFPSCKFPNWIYREPGCCMPPIRWKRDFYQTCSYHHHNDDNNNKPFKEPRDTQVRPEERKLHSIHFLKKLRSPFMPGKLDSTRAGELYGQRKNIGLQKSYSGTKGIPQDVYSTDVDDSNHQGQGWGRFLHPVSIGKSAMTLKTPGSHPQSSSVQLSKRYISPSVWQTLIERNAYHYGQNFLDSIAGELLK